MRVEDLTVALRPRSSWEAVDLGMRLVRTHARPLARVSAGVSLPVMALVLATTWRHPLLMVTLLWWVSPVADRALVRVLGGAVFAAPPARPIRDAWRGLGGVLLEVLFFRLDPRRSATVAVDALEGGGGRAAARRQRIAASVGGVALLTATLARAVELGLWFGGASLADVLSTTPPGVDAALEGPAALLLDEVGAGEAIALGALLAAILLAVRPFTVGAGFALYLNHRIHTEGWDLEVALRRLARRLGAAGAVLLALTLPPLARAGEPPQDPQMVVEEVLADDVFGGTEARTRLVSTLDFPEWDATGPTRGCRAPLDAPHAPHAPHAPATGAVSTAEALPAVLAGLVVLLPLLALALWRARRGPRTPHATAAVRHLDPQLPLHGPADPAAHAQAAFRQGDADRALALLYASAVARLTDHLDLRLPPGATERDCQRAVRRRGEADTATWFADLVRARLRTAYGHVPLDAAAFDALATGWRRHVGPLAGALLVVLLAGCALEEVEEEVGPRGPARANPHLAAERLLTGLGRSVRPGMGIPQDPPHDAIIALWSTDPMVQELAWGRLEPWVAAGGVLVAPVVRADDRGLLDATALWFADEGDGDADAAGGIAAAVGYQVQAARSGSGWIVEDEVAGRDFALARGPRLAPASGPRLGPAWWAVDDTDRAWLFASAEPWGDGTVVLLSSPDPFTNDTLGEAAHATLLWSVLDAVGAPDAPVVSVSRVAGPPLRALLWRHTPMFLVGAVLAFVLAGWRALVRDGPPVPDARPVRRALVEHVEAVGAWSWRTGRSGALLDALRLRLRAEAPWLARADDPVRALAARVGWTEADVAPAFAPLDPTDRAGFIRAVRTLSALHAALCRSPA